jgi:hypothetical protein
MCRPCGGCDQEITGIRIFFPATPGRESSIFRALIQAAFNYKLLRAYASGYPLTRNSFASNSATFREGIIVICWRHPSCNGYPTRRESAGRSC